MTAPTIVSRAWGGFARVAATALGLDLDELPAVDAMDAPLTWRSVFAVDELALDSVAFASAAIAAVDAGPRSPLVMDPRAVQASFGSDRLIRIDGEVPPIWAPLSGFWRAADGWVRTHANYPHHEQRLHAVLRLGPSAGRNDVAAAIAEWDSRQLEEAAARAGAIVAAVREPEVWDGHPQARVLAASPLIETTVHGDAEPRPWSGRSGLPLAGLRVLDLTRVIAGPVATRDLAYAGADVLRIDSPALGEPLWQHLDTGHGKRSALLDLRHRSDRAAFDDLLDRADVLVTGYRPGALEELGLGGHDLAARHPGLVIARVSAWGHEGPWASRRGFDSIVQATIGIAWAEGEHSASGALESPGALPVQALDHGAGHLLAGAVAVALRRQRLDGGTREVGVALARVGQELRARAAASPPTVGTPEELPTTSTTIDMGEGAARRLTTAPPVLALRDPEQSGAWRSRPHGGDLPVWRSDEDESETR